MTHRILTEHPEHRRLVAERAKLAASRGAFHARQADAEATFRQAQAEHDREAQKALLEGREPPPPPTYAPPAGDYAIFEGEENRLIHDERRFHAEQGGELRVVLASREAELVREAEVVLSQLAPIVDEMNRVVGAARVVDAGQRAFANAYGRPGAAVQGGIYDRTVDVGTLIDAVGSGRRFVGLGEALPERPAAIVSSQGAG
jgi:hypothetical protein